MAMPSPTCSIIIVTYNTRELTLGCLRSLLGGGAGIRLQIIVIDNASTDATGPAIAKQFPTVHLLQNPNNRGFSAAVNQGLGRATEEIIFLLNPDARVQADTLKKLLETLAANPQLGAVGPIIVGPNGDVQHHCAAQQVSVRGQLAWHLRLPTAYNRMHLEANCGPHGARITRRLSGAAVAVRRTVFEEVGPLDERFFMYFEDADLSLRIRQRGYQLACVTRARMIHEQGASSRQDPTARSKHALDSELRYFGKHGAALPTLILRGAIAAKASVRALTVDLIALAGGNADRWLNDVRILFRCLQR